MSFLNPENIINNIMENGGGRDFNIKNSFRSNTSDIFISENSQEQIFSQIPENIQVNNEKSLNIVDALHFPDDLGSDSNPHYVKFEVYILNTGKGTKGVAGSFGENKLDDSATPRYSMNIGTSEGQTRSANLGNPVFKKIDQLLALPVPETVTTEHSTIWSTAEGGLVSGMIAMGDELVNGSGTLSEKAVKAVKRMTLGTASGIAGILEQMNMEGASTNLKLLTKRASNPRNEFLFDGVNNRSFNFQWKFIPRTESEAAILQFILEKFKLYMYPELDQSTNGAFYLFPAIFDITFMSGAQENKWLLRTSSCALTNMSINYTGAGQWVAFDYLNIPYAIDVSMQFTELEFLHRNRFISDSNPNGVAR